jgi:uncharacterized membrane protein (UPF0127 family)
MILLEIEGYSIRAEVADEPAERQGGLMYRVDLEEDAGMIFVYPDQKLRSFWMENTRIPLSIAYINQAGTIVQIADMIPFDRTGVPSGEPAMYALEMNRGQFKVLGISKGAKVNGLPGPSEQ